MSVMLDIFKQEAEFSFNARASGKIDFRGFKAIGQNVVRKESD